MCVRISDMLSSKISPTADRKIDFFVYLFVDWFGRQLAIFYPSICRRCSLNRFAAVSHSWLAYVLSRIQIRYCQHILTLDKVENLCCAGWLEWNGGA
jgi:hypothetical protein